MQKMVRGSGKKLAVSPVWYQWQTTTPFSSPDTTRFLSTGDQCTAETEFCVGCSAACSLQGAPERHRADPHLVGRLLPDQHLAVRVPEANRPIVGGADADVTLTRMLAERKARHQELKSTHLRCPYPPQIQGMSIDQAIAQLEFNDKKGAKIMKEVGGGAFPFVLEEAQEMAVKNHNVEYKSNLYVAESFSGKGKYLKRIRYHGRGMCGIMDRVNCHYFVKLVEGSPPRTEEKTSFDQAKEYVQGLKSRTIVHSLSPLVIGSCPSGSERTAARKMVLAPK
ncbi:39S ribosomal protein L22, mitochondrial [Liparis tanakae]|uniref:Large ribosomal subunit protein uL22m n=1 Tax=Liparis tanakae TaxID=230148 RepID=A0A4Z2HTI1_9TELE|nr:39S ribosomal protein L22, mitochondrial [Liparis tanakae]